MSASAQNLRARNLRTIGALAALFVLPLALSFWMYYGGGWQPAGRTNHGELFQPPRPLQLAQWPQARALSGKWAMIYNASGTCAVSCQNALLVMRQTRLSLNNKMDRVVRVLIARQNCCDPEFLEREHRGLVVLDSESARAQPVLQAFPNAGRDDSLFLVDPLGNLVLRYDARDDPKGLLRDLEKLLKLSHIG